jgi:hypothetical protein
MRSSRSRQDFAGVFVQVNQRFRIPADSVGDPRDLPSGGA